MKTDSRAEITKKISGNLPVTVLGDVARQHGGLSLTSRNPQTGALFFLGKRRLSRTGQIDLTDSAQLQGEAIHTPNTWINGMEPLAPVLRLEAALEIKTLDELGKPLKLTELAKLHQAVKNRITTYFTEQVRGPDIELLDSKLEEQAKTELPKIMAIKTVLDEIETPMSRASASSLEDISSLLSTYITPGFNPDIAQPHLDKARRILTSERSIKVFNALTEKGGAKLAADLEIETIQFASEINHFRLVSGFEKYMIKDNPDFSLRRYKETITKQILPYLEKINATEPGKMEAEIKKYIFPYIRPMIRYVVDHYKHDDTASLLGVNLQNKLANCAGKTDMLNMLFKDLGLDSRDSNVQINRDGRLYRHKFNHLYLPGDHIIEVDGNQSAFQDEANELFHCDVAIMRKKNRHPIPLSNFPTWEELMRTTTTQYILKDKYLDLYERIWGSETHKVTADTVQAFHTFDLHNLFIEYVNSHQGNSQSSNTELLYLTYGMHQLMMEESAHQTNFKNVSALIMARCISEGRQFHHGEKFNMLEMTKEISRTCIEESPYDPNARLKLIRILKYQQQYTNDPEQLEQLGREIEMQYRKTIALSRILPDKIFPAESKTDVLKGLIVHLSSTEYANQVLKGKPYLARNNQKEMLLILENMRNQELEPEWTSYATEIVKKNLQKLAG